jgi:hypothetical protein
MKKLMFDWAFKALNLDESLKKQPVWRVVKFLKKVLHFNESTTPLIYLISITFRATLNEMICRIG